ncbi:hypothetical protein RHMOL_Rhmol10G0081700 [Rhododendron molle]|uniref:Uncharacterized protein n=1 Tax=Rhododendron molle TaxID=49168 RepID=A0ACC0M0A3_RHOML|nr:hypothetical protein RHMOL_Rhmol10G0081700 [Rhododendron molle]
MAGLLAWAADVVGAGGHSNDEDDTNATIPLVFTPEQQHYVRDLDLKAKSLNRSIQDLRLRLPPPDISQRLPHLHAHSLASNAALALQLNAHSTTKEQGCKRDDPIIVVFELLLAEPSSARSVNEPDPKTRALLVESGLAKPRAAREKLVIFLGQAQLREVTLREENAAFEKAISDCGNKIQEKLQEANLLQSKLQEMDLTEKNLKAELDNVIAALDDRQSGKSGELLVDSTVKAQEDTEASESDLLGKLENKKQELGSMEVIVQDLEKKWAQVQENALKQPSPAQREKMLDKQLHSLIEQLATKQAQAEGLVGEIHLKEMELERLNGLWKRLETSTGEANTARNRLGRSNSGYIVDPHHRPPYHVGGRNETQQRLMLLRSAFVLYILALHILVFIKISF